MGWDEDSDKFVFGTTSASGSSFNVTPITYQTVKASTFEGALSGKVLLLLIFLVLKQLIMFMPHQMEVAALVRLSFNCS